MKLSSNDRCAVEMHSKIGKLIIQSRHPRKIGDILPQLKAEDKIRLIVAEECTRAEYLSQHEVEMGQARNYYNPDWPYFYRVEAAD